MKSSRLLLLGVGVITGCTETVQTTDRIVPATEFSQAVQRGEGQQFSIFEAVDKRDAGMQNGLPVDARMIPVSGHAGEVRLNEPNGLVQPAAASTVSRAALKDPSAQVPEKFSGDPRYVKEGYRFVRSFQDPISEQPPSSAPSSLPAAAGSMLPPPPGSSAPYLSGQMTANPSLWPDEAQGASLFRDHRAFQSMDIITVLISESSEGKKKADTKADSKFSISAAISNFFGLEVDKLGNPNVDPTALVNATTDSKLDTKGETKRTGELTAKMSAIILEVLPNGLLRIEGTKIISVNNEEEIMVLSGLVRPRDIDASNRIESDRVANMRIDFYGRGVLADQQTPGWGVKLFEYVWPF